MINIIMLIIAIIGVWGSIYLIGDAIKEICEIKNKEENNDELQ